MSTDLPADDEPRSTGGKVLGAMPIILTVLATILAGLSSSEMTQSMYFRSLAAQNQSKSGSQWAFFQAKRIRGTSMETSGDLLRALSDPATLNVQQMRQTAARAVAAADKAADAAVIERIKSLQQQLDQALNQSSVENSLRFLVGPELPAVNDKRIEDEALQAVVKSIRSRRTEAQTVGEVAKVSETRVEEAIELAEANAAAFDEACKPVIADERTIERVFTSFSNEIRTLREGPQRNVESSTAIEEAAKSLRDTLVALRAAKQEFTARRYAKEATYNQESAELFEVLVRRTGIQSDRHRQRSRNFFYAMLCAQAGVTVASFALARTRKNWFWAVAGMAGFVALALGAYVYWAL